MKCTSLVHPSVHFIPPSSTITINHTTSQVHPLDGKIYSCCGGICPSLKEVAGQWGSIGGDVFGRRRSGGGITCSDECHPTTLCIFCLHGTSLCIPSFNAILPGSVAPISRDTPALPVAKRAACHKNVLMSSPKQREVELY